MRSYLRLYVFYCLVAVSFYSGAKADFDPQLEFEKALKLREQGQHTAAIKIFHSILANYPQLHRARLELAVAYYRLLQYENAKRAATQVLNQPATPIEVKNNIRAFLAKIDGFRPRHYFSATATAGMMYDSNVTGGPDDSVLAGLPLSSVSSSQSDQAIITQLGFSHRYHKPNIYRINQQSVSLLWLSRLEFYQADFRDFDSQDLLVTSLSSGPALISTKRWRSALNVQVDRSRLDYDDYANFIAINPSHTFIREKNNSELVFDLFMQVRDYKRAVDFGRDSDYLAFGFSYGRLLLNDKFSYQFGVRSFVEDAEFSYFSNDGVEWFAGFSYRQSARTNYLFRFSQKQSKFEGLEPGFAVKRDENMDRFVFAVEHALRKLPGWMVKVNWSYIDNRSNVPIFDYDRQQSAILINKTF